MAREVDSVPFSWSPRGQIVFETSREGFASVSPSGHRQQVPRGAMPPLWSPDGSKLAIMRGANLYARNVKGGPYLRVNRIGKRVDLFAAWSPDGKQIAYSETRPHVHSSVVVVNALNGHVEKVIPFKRITWVVAWR